MKICILSDENWRDCDPTPYLNGHAREMHLIYKASVNEQIRDLAARGFDVFLNLCDGAWGEDVPGIEVVQALEKAGVAFTGAASDFYEPSREWMKRVCRRVGVGTPAGIFATDARGVERAAGSLRFPLIVKHPNSYCSVGMTRESRVENIAALRAQAERMIEAYGSALIEEFIEGREFSVLVVESLDAGHAPIAYMPVEFRFPEGESFKHYDLKWNDFRTMECVRCEDAGLAARLVDISKKMFVGMRGSGYGRCDIRMDARGELFMLEINPNCGVFFAPDESGSADFVLMYDPIGHTGFVEHLLNLALSRQRRQRRRQANTCTPLHRPQGQVCVRCKSKFAVTTAPSPPARAEPVKSGFERYRQSVGMLSADK